MVNTIPETNRSPLKDGWSPIGISKLPEVYFSGAKRLVSGSVHDTSLSQKLGDSTSLERTPRTKDQSDFERPRLCSVPIDQVVSWMNLLGNPNISREKKPEITTNPHPNERNSQTSSVGWRSFWYVKGVGKFLD